MRVLRLLIAVAVLAALLATQAARYLVVDAPVKSDAIVVLAGETKARPARGLELLRQGMAPRMFLDAEVGGEIYDQTLTRIAQKYISSLPDADHISLCAIESRSTFGETAAVARCLEPSGAWLGAHRVLLVTSDYHSRRALSIFEHRLPQYQWSVAAAHNAETFGDQWWMHREWAKMTLDEWMKLTWWELVDRWKR
jgi:uncharacterized SAM-binding protein YcdF (DUF218 family)